MGKLLSGMWATLLLAGMAAAQQMGVTPGMLVPGQSVQITYSDPSRAGTTIQVRVSGGNSDNPTVFLVPVVLDGQGHGQAHWIAVNWWSVYFNAPGVDEQMRCIDSPDDGDDSEVQ